MPTTRTWTGAVNNDASNPGNWTPSGAPAAGDTLNVSATVTSGPPWTVSETLDISGGALHGDQLNVGGTGLAATLNLSHHATADVSFGGFGTQLTVNVDGNDTLNLSMPGEINATSITVNLADHAKLNGSWDTSNNLLTNNVVRARSSTFPPRTSCTPSA
jgi:hypothetical protein